MRTFFILVFFLLSAAGARAQVTGSLFPAGVTVTHDDPGNCANSTISVTVPAPWQIVCAQGFENGAVTGSETVLAGASGGINTNIPHSGAYSLEGLYNAPDQTVSWYLQPGNLGTFGEIYISFYERVDMQALYPDSDFFYGGIVQPMVCGQIQDTQFDMQNFSGQQSSTAANLVLVSEGYDSQATPCMGKYQYSTSARLSINAGFWRHYEFDIVPSTQVFDSSTCIATNNGSDCTGNGSYKVFIDGAPFMSGTRADLNGITDMSNAGVGVGGVLTDLSGCGSWSSPSCPGSRPGAWPPAPFHREIDDVVVLKIAAGGGAPPPPPPPPPAVYFATH
jgi:hypothetical protein